MLGHGATGQFAIGEVPFEAGAESITPDKWFERLSEPPRFKPGLLAAQQQFIALPGPFPFVSFAWFEELSKPPVLTKPGLQASEQQFFAFNPLPRVSFAWFEGLSEPPRFKPGLPAALQQFFTIDTSVIPLHELMEWFAALSEPVRFKPALLTALQQFFAAPPQLRPTPTITGILAAIETKDSFLGGASVFNRVASGEVGVTESKTTGNEVGVNIPTIARATIAITIL